MARNNGITGAIPGAGRKPKYKEVTKVISFKVPISKADDFKDKAKKILKSYE